MKDFSKYQLMHRDDPVALFIIDNFSGTLLKIEKIYNEVLIPLGGQRSLQDLKVWWNRRPTPLTQRNFKKLLDNNNLATSQVLLVRNLGLSLIDHYWIKPINTDYCWSEVNLFENPFTELKLKSLDNSSVDLHNCTTFYPGASLQGELEKKWVRGSNNAQYLIKGNYGQTEQQSANEVFATLLHTLQRRHKFTEYKFCKLSTEFGEQMGCICKNFATMNLEFIPAWEVIYSLKKPNDVSDYEHFINVCVLYGLNKFYVRDFLEYQILTDFVLTNTDRHYNNFGVLRDSNTLKFVELAPIFDTGNCLFWKNPKVIDTTDLTRITVSSFRRYERDLLKYITDFSSVNISKLPNPSELKKLLNKIQLINKAKTIECIIKAYELKIEMLNKYQSQFLTHEF